MAGSSSKSEEVDLPKADAAVVAVSSGGELPKSDIVKAESEDVWLVWEDKAQSAVYMLLPTRQVHDE
jgi:hypothetical protein